MRIELHRRQLRHTDIAGEVTDHRHVAEGGATRPAAVKRGRHLTKGARQVRAIRGSLGGHPAAMAQPGHRGQATVVLPTPLVVKAVEAAQELRLEPIDRAPDVDQILTQGERGEAVDELADEGIDRLVEPALGARYCSRYHTREYSKRLFVTVPCGAGPRPTRTNAPRVATFTS